MRWIAIALSPALAAVALAQAPPVVDWSFDTDVGEWISMDPNGRLSIVTDANVVREEGGGVLEYAYTPQVGVFSALLTPVATALGGGQSLRYWIKSSDYAWVGNILAEDDGSRYIAIYSCLPDRWQEVALGFGEFQLTDDSEDENGKLDPDQVAAIIIADATILLAQLAEQVPFIQPPELGPRMLWLDELAVDPGAVEPRWEATEIDGVPAVRLDSFESAPLQWLTIAAEGVELAYDTDHQANGEFSLRAMYDLPQGKAFGLGTTVAGPDLGGMKRMKLAIISEAPTMLLIELKERDGSKYHSTVQLEGGNEFQPVELPLSDFALADDSDDENGALDAGQLKELLIADISGVGQLPGMVNTLWLDDVAFTE